MSPTNFTSASAQKKARVFAFIPNTRYRERPARAKTAEEIRLDEDMAALFGDVRDEEGRPPTPDFGSVARGTRFPWRIMARYVVRAARKGADEQCMIVIAERFVLFVREVFRAYGRRRAA